MSTASAKTVFISHASPDNPFAQQLHDKLMAHGYDSWIDTRELTGGNGLLPVIKQAIVNSYSLLVVLSPQTINSLWVTREVEYALKLQKVREDGFKVIPLLLPGM